MLSDRFCWINIFLTTLSLCYTCLICIQTSFDNRQRAIQNIVLTGGSCMVAGFRKRLLQEIKAFIQTRPEFEGLRTLEKKVRIPENIFAPNIAAWSGASILMSLGQDVDRFLLTAEQYKKEGDRLPDRFGEAFLTFEREGDFFNKNWEINYKQNKQMQFENTSPFSARSLQSRTASIASIVHRQLTMGSVATPHNNYR